MMLNICSCIREPYINVQLIILEQMQVEQTQVSSDTSSHLLSVLFGSIPRLVSLGPLRPSHVIKKAVCL
jgi:hypothetical protein